MGLERVRVSVGTASVLGLLQYRLSIPPTTAYVMTYTEESCLANCSFCAQARANQANRDQLSRVLWPDYSLMRVLEGFRKPRQDVLERICVQVIYYSGFLEDTIDLVRKLKDETALPISIDICPVDKNSLYRLREAGAEMISIPLDAATQRIFDEIKGRDVMGPYRWERHIEALKEAVEVFGEGNVGSNLIVGLGETEREAVELIQSLHDMNVQTVLFAFTPIAGTRLEDQSPPQFEKYRRLQVARHLIVNGYVTLGNLSFDKDDRIASYGEIDLDAILRDGKAFMTTGCPGCNRPFYNERPSGPFYNYPRHLTEEEIKAELTALKTK